MLNLQHLEVLNQTVNEKLKQQFLEINDDLPMLEKQLAEVNQKYRI